MFCCFVCLLSLFVFLFACLHEKIVSQAGAVGVSLPSVPRKNMSDIYRNTLIYGIGETETGEEIPEGGQAGVLCSQA